MEASSARSSNGFRTYPKGSVSLAFCRVSESE